MRTALQRSQDHLEHRLRSLQHIIVPEADHAPAISIQIGCPAVVHSMRIDMLAAIELDDEAALHAREVREVGADWVLAPEAISGQATVAHVEPQPMLGVSHVPAE